MKKITALLFAILILVTSLISCGSTEDVPKGLINVTAEGEPFKLYVPEEMTSNVQSGISGAFTYVLGNAKLVVSARYYTPSVEMTAEGYLRTCAEGYAESLEEFDLVSVEATVLGGKDSCEMKYTVTIDKIKYTCLQYAVLNKSDIVSLYFYIPTDAYEMSSEMIEKVTKEFVLCDRPEDSGDEVVDKKTPEGMKIASSDKIEYRLYVPKSWVCNSESGKSEAYYPESERSNVTVTSYSPNEAMTLADYVNACKESYAEAVDGYELISETEAVMAERDAVSLTYTAVYDGIQYRIRQTSVLYGKMLYTLTYTARAEVFEEHLGDVDKMVEVFTFR